MTKNHVKHGFAIAITIAYILALNFYILGSYFPLNEGWWDFWAWQSEHLKLYEDVKISFAPLPIYYAKFLNYLSSDQILGAREWGSCFHALFCIAIYALLYDLTNQKSSSFVSAVLVTLILEAIQFYPTTTYIVRDYQQLIIFELALLFLLLGKRTAWPPVRPYLIIAVFCLIMATKQNIAIAVFPGVLIALFKPNGSLIRGIINVTIFMAAIVLAFYIPEIPWYKAYIGNESKGSYATILTRFIWDNGILKIIVLSFPYGAILTLQLLNDEKVKAEMAKRSHPKLYAYYCQISNYKKEIFLISTISLIAVYKLNAIIISAIASLLVFAASIFFREQFSRPIKVNQETLLVLLGLTYAGTLASGFSVNNMYFPIAYSALVYAQFIERKYINTILALTLLTITGGYFFSRTYVTQYDWWGYQSKGKIESHNKGYFPELNGLRVDEFTSKVLRLVYQDRLKTEGKRSVYIYPHMPLLYKFINEIPRNKNSVLWFDVSSEKDGFIAVQELRKNPPEIVYWLLVPEAVRRGHFDLRRANSAISIVDEHLFSETKKNNYRVTNVIYNFRYVPEYMKLKDDWREVNAQIYPISGSDFPEEDKCYVETSLSEKVSKNFRVPEAPIDLIFKNRECYERFAPLMGIDFGAEAPFIFLKLIRQ